ncbi:YuzD family protein [Bacillus massilinigeriensis]|uniref:YuzD family protein n=1 Tax=Bacillus mediterraneensis TaxID=1805474 RepID=UPI0008F82516|nr:YuzD family protein [Bacillus mediterraneensis]
MGTREVEIVVYGADQICASCVGQPSSTETYEWLKAAVGRKYPDQPFTITFVDIFNPPKEPVKMEFSRRVLEEDMFYPVVVIDEIIVGEGSPRLKNIYTEMEKHGYKSA